MLGVGDTVLIVGGSHRGRRGAITRFTPCYVCVRWEEGPMGGLGVGRCKPQNVEWARPCVLPKRVYSLRDPETVDRLADLVEELYAEENEAQAAVAVTTVRMAAKALVTEDD